MLGNDRVEDSTGKLVWVFRHASDHSMAELPPENYLRASNTRIGHYRWLAHLVQVQDCRYSI